MSTKTLAPKTLNDIVHKVFDDHFLWLTESKGGGNTPDKSTAKFIIRQYLLKKNPDITSNKIEKYFTEHNIAMVMRLLEKFYKSRGVYKEKVVRSRSKSPKKRKTKKKSTSRKSSKTSRKFKSPSRKSKSPRKSSKSSRRAGKRKSTPRKHSKSSRKMRKNKSSRK
jgi:hypothetical protein